MLMSVTYFNSGGFSFTTGSSPQRETVGSINILVTGRCRQRLAWENGTSGSINLTVGEGDQYGGK